MIYVQTKQSVFPKTLYIGDRAELRCTFKSDLELSTGVVSTEGFVQLPDFSVCDIQEISVQSAQSALPEEKGNYNLIISFIPWRTGKIQLPDFELENAGVIHFEPVEILSLVEQEQVTDLRSYTSPLLLPGTTYRIYAGIAVLVILIILFIRLIVKWRALVFWFKNTRLKLRYARSKKNTIKALKKLEAEEGADNENHSKDSLLCTALQKIMREYLELRLDYPFTKKLTSELNLAFEQASCGLADENRLQAFEQIIAVFIRTDYIRFSKGENAVCKPGEFSELINTLVNSIEVIESVKPAENEEEGGGNA